MIYFVDTCTFIEASVKRKGEQYILLEMFSKKRDKKILLQSVEEEFLEILDKWSDKYRKIIIQLAKTKNIKEFEKIVQNLLKQRGRSL